MRVYQNKGALVDDVCHTIDDSQKLASEIVLSVTTQFSDNGIVPLATTQLLSWTHHEKLLQVEDKETRDKGGLPFMAVPFRTICQGHNERN